MNKRIFALLLCIVLCAAMALSYAFIALESDHDCTAHHCRICAELQICRLLIRSISQAIVALAAVAGAAYFAAGLCRALPKIIRINNTLVSLKIKLLN